MDLDYLFALRTYYQDNYDDESDIINYLRNHIIRETNCSIYQSNNILENFYNSFGVNINISESNQLTNENLDSDSEDTVNSNDTFNSDNNLEINNNSRNDMLYFIFSSNSLLVNNYTSDFENIICTLDDSEIERLENIIYDKDDNIKCNICLDNIIKNQKIINLNCEHTYHSECIIPYLKNYNYKCPTCRKEIGKPKYNL